MNFDFSINLLLGDENDEVSKKFLQNIEDQEISSRLQKPQAICIKLQAASQSFKQFSQIYPVILVPAIYFINSENGTNVETTGGDIDKAKILASIDKAFEGKSVGESIVSPRNERVEQARQVIQNDVVTKEPSEENPSTPTTTMSLDERVERAKKLLAEKQAQKAKNAEEVSRVL